MRYIVFLFFILFLYSCSSRRDAASVSTTYDSTHSFVSNEHIERIDTVYYNIPRQSSERSTFDTISVLENDFCITFARAHSDGTLYHCLSTKNDTVPVQFKRIIERIDSVVYRDRIINKDNTITEYVEHELSWWEQAQIYGFWAAIIVFAITYRRKIFQAIVRALF